MAWARAEIIPRFGRVHAAPIVAQEYMADSAGHFGPAEEACTWGLRPILRASGASWLAFSRRPWHIAGGSEGGG